MEKDMRRTASLLTSVARIAATLAGFALPISVFAQPAPSTGAAPAAPVFLTLAEPRFKGELGRTFQDSDPPQFPQPARPPVGAPKVVVVLLNDAGFGQFSSFARATPSPTVDRLAAENVSGL
jgi:hypothetical protein